MGNPLKSFESDGMETNIVNDMCELRRISHDTSNFQVEFVIEFYCRNLFTIGTQLVG
jgi:hypothetical protein